MPRTSRHIPPVAVPRYSLGATLRATRIRFTGRVDAIYADFEAAADSGVVSRTWFAMQTAPPSTPDQIFYSLVDLTGLGAVLVGENEAEPASENPA